MTKFFQAFEHFSTLAFCGIVFELGLRLHAAFIFREMALLSFELHEHIVLIIFTDIYFTYYLFFRQVVNGYQSGRRNKLYFENIHDLLLLYFSNKDHIFFQKAVYERRNHSKILDKYSIVYANSDKTSRFGRSSARRLFDYFDNFGGIEMSVIAVAYESYDSKIKATELRLFFGYSTVRSFDICENHVQSLYVN